MIERAKLVLAKLEQEDRAAPKGFEDLPLFAVPPKAPQDKPEMPRVCLPRPSLRSTPMTCRRVKRWKRFMC